MPDPRPESRLLYIASLTILIGAPLSGPIGALIPVLTGHAQPWTTVEAFISSYSPILSLTYWFGFILITGWIMYIAALTQIASTAVDKTYAAIALIFVAVFAAIIGLNYTIQVSFVPGLIRAANPATALFSMSSPVAIAWSLEMSGYGFLGLATWFAAPLFHHSGRSQTIRWLLVANGVASLASAVLTAFGTGWITTLPGVVAYAAWNVLIIAIAWLTAVECRRGRL